MQTYNFDFEIDGLKLTILGQFDSDESQDWYEVHDVYLGKNKITDIVADYVIKEAECEAFSRLQQEREDSLIELHRFSA